MPVSNYDELKICNAILALLGEDAIVSIVNPTTDVEATCSEILPLVISTILSKHEWDCANPTRKLAADEGKSVDFKDGYRYAFRLPSNLLAGPFAVYEDNERRRPATHYIVKENFVLTNSPICWVKYRARPSVSEMPMYLIDLIIVAGASRLAKPVADNTALATEYRIQAFGDASLGGNGGMFADAKAIDAQSRPVQSLFRNGDPLSATRH